MLLPALHLQYAQYTMDVFGLCQHPKDTAHAAYDAIKQTCPLVNAPTVMGSLCPSPAARTPAGRQPARGTAHPPPLR